MNSFSERMGFEPIKNIIQIESMDGNLRIGIWNTLTTYYWHATEIGDDYLPGDDGMYAFCKLLWTDYFKIPLDEMGSRWRNVYTFIRKFYFETYWYKVYDFTEFVANYYPNERKNREFMSACNSILERELSGYRFVSSLITPISNDEEINTLEKAQSISDDFKPVKYHLIASLKKLSDRESPDYRNSIKESISAIESLSKIISGQTKADFADAMKILEAQLGIHGALRKAFIALYGYTSDADGIRHALLDEPNLDFSDAKFMLVTCSAFVNYIIAKQANLKKSD